MPKKIKVISSIFNNKEPKHHPWQWPSCKQSKTLSFRADDDLFPPKYSWSRSSFDDPPPPSPETVTINARNSGRLFFEPEPTRSIAKPSKNEKLSSSILKEGVAVALESADPYTDFKRSMAEVVESSWDWDWDRLEELLVWYLKMNGKTNHRFIVGAFVDLLLGFAGVESKKTMIGSDEKTTSYSSVSSSFSSLLPQYHK